jgi:hypothetical protein
MSFLSLRNVAALMLALVLSAGGASAQQQKKKKKKQAASKSVATKPAKAGTAKTAAPYTGDPIPPPQQPEQPDGVRRITPAEARAAIEKGTAIIVDVRNDVVYQASHVKGAILIPSNEIGAYLNQLPRDKMIITYCS